MGSQHFDLKVPCRLRIHSTSTWKCRVDYGFTALRPESAVSITDSQHSDL